MQKLRMLLTASVLGFGLVTISGCSLLPEKEVVVTAKPIERPALNVPQPDELRMIKLEWVVLTEENAIEVLDALDKSGRPVVLFALTDKGYESLSLNISNIRSYIEQQNTIIAAYEAYYDMAAELEGDMGEPSNQE